MTMKPGERQVAPTIDGIRRDHVARYEFAARAIGKHSKRVIDFACGVGYGSNVLAKAGHRVRGYDVDEDALSYARTHFRHAGARFNAADARDPDELGTADVAVCFETVEHLEDPRPLLRALRAAAPRLIASVPNETLYPYTGQAYHYRHYTLAQFEQLLAECGWTVTEWHGQDGPESDVAAGLAGRTLIAVAKRGKVRAPVVKMEPVLPPAPRHVAILGLGPSLERYSGFVKRLGGRRGFCDETWGINAVGDVYACDLVFHMDDMRVQELRAAAQPESNIAAMVKWLRSYPGRVITSIPPAGSSMEAFPLEAVLNAFPTAYFNSTAAYAVAYAVHLGVKRISLFGIDFTYPNAHDAEKGRACVEFWLGIAAARGIEISMPKETSLMDACAARADRFYGFDCVDLDIRRRDGRIAVEMTERARMPTAEEIEERYDHSVHPNPLVEGAP
jgi:SAM-dependent methyltransferase